MSLLPGNVRGLLFDKDGTLIDFAPTWMPAYRAAAELVARQAGRPVGSQLLLAGGLLPDGSFDPSSALAAGTMVQVCEIWSALLGVDLDVAAIEHLVFEHTTSHPVPTTELSPLLLALREQGLRLGMATMDSTAAAWATSQALGIAQLWDFCAGYDAGHGLKPGPGMVLAFAARVGLEPSAVAVVGDTPHDMQMAHAAGALAIGVTTGVTSRTRLVAEADLVIDSLEALVA